MVFAELLQKGLDRFKKAPPKKNKVKDGYNADKAKDAAPPRTESVPKDNLIERVASTSSRLDTFRSGRSEGEANPSMSRPASGKSQKSNRWDSIRNMVKSNPASKAGSQAGSQAGLTFSTTSCACAVVRFAHACLTCMAMPQAMNLTHL